MKIRGHIIVARLALVILLLLLALPLLARPVRASTYTVTNTKDDALLGSLRRAMLEANNNPGSDTIVFNIPSSDPGYSSATKVWKIQLLTPLPGMGDGGTIIDGATQTANQGDSNVHGPEVQIDGANLGGDASLFYVESNANQILGLVLTHAPGPGVRIIVGASGNIVRDNYIGTDPGGTMARGNGAGIHVSSGARENVIAHNVISGNNQDGIVITGNGTESNHIRRNIIGLDFTGMAAVPNQWDGIAIANGAAWNVVGGDPGYRNYIGGNGLNGVRIYGSGTNRTMVSNNHIGIDSSGVGSVDVGNSHNGVAIDGGVQSTWIMLNLISGNEGHGVYIEGGGTEHIWVLANTIGANAQVTAGVPNGLHGVAVYDGAANVEVGDASNTGNVIVASGWSGVAIVNSRKVSAVYNDIGTDAAGTATNLGNSFHGIAIVNSPDNAVRFNRVAYNGTQATRAGVLVDGASATGNTISHNSIHDNSGKGIALHNGGNNGFAAPSINMASCVHIGGDSCANCTLEFFSDEADEGRVYEGNMQTHQWTWAFSWTGKVTGPNVTVTATDQQGNTSEFSSPWVGACNRIHLPLVLRNS